MSLACLACHSVESPSRSFRSYSVSSSDNEGRCTAIANCITRKLSHPPPRANSSFASSSSKVTPQPLNPIKLTFPLDEFAFVIILGKSNAKSCSYFISFDLPLLILNFVAKCSVDGFVSFSDFSPQLPLPFWIVVVVDLQLIWPLLICDNSSEHVINKSRDYGDLFLSCGCFQGAPSSLLHCTDLEKPELAAWVNALPLAGHHHVLPLVVDPSPLSLRYTVPGLSSSNSPVSSYFALPALLGWLSPWELHVDFLTCAFYLKDSSFTSIILSSRSRRANQLSLSYTIPGFSSSNSPVSSYFALPPSPFAETTSWVPSPHACIFLLIWSALLGWLSPWELHVDFLTCAFNLKDSSFPSIILSSRSHRANQNDSMGSFSTCLRFPTYLVSTDCSQLLSIFFGVVSSQVFLSINLVFLFVLFPIAC
ncbi:hypothetical protein NC653_041629 [Populus alba x Populus x berolinensis]|uniref:Uncharacterized protein n=1 Tax=Populus alba x Populus x berolinensis TaxID=444605 RepID=A0AAD6L912_9ROSI|nr:hypothetical protein NC653_041629 [Populus alba x Populus x berolinensis]